MEYVDGPTMYDFLQGNGGQLGEEGGWYFMQQIVEFLGYLQKVKVAHKDLKLENILVTAEMKIKVIDFDFAENTTSGKLSKDYGGTKVYMAPEVLANKAHDGHRADMYAAGVILFAIVVGSFPFSKADDNGYKLFCSNPK